MVAIGLKSGECILKNADSLLSDEMTTTIVPEDPFKDDQLHRQPSDNITSIDDFKGQNSTVDEPKSGVTEKITSLQLLHTPNRIVFGSNDGYVSFYNITKKETLTFQLEAK